MPDHACDSVQHPTGQHALWEELCAVKRERDALKAELDKALAFKTWTHQYLDAHGIPHHPPGTHGAAGCRIGDRMDWLMSEQARYREALAWYADSNNWRILKGNSALIQWDEGVRAREALRG